MKIVVTGAGGFIAQNIIRHLSNLKNIRIKGFLKKKTKVYKSKNITYEIKKIENIKKKRFKRLSCNFSLCLNRRKKFL